MSSRTYYLALAAPCILNIIGMLMAAMGSAFRGGQESQQWFALGLAVGGLLLLAIFSSLRAAQVGWSPLSTFLGVLLTAATGVLLLVMVAALTLRNETDPSQSISRGGWMWPLMLLLLPWGFLLAFGAIASR